MLRIESISDIIITAAATTKLFLKSKSDLPVIIFWAAIEAKGISIPLIIRIKTPANSNTIPNSKIKTATTIGGPMTSILNAKKIL